MHIWNKTLRHTAAVAALGAVVLTGTLQQAYGQAAAAPAKNYKPGEYELFNEVVKDVNGSQFPKAITDLDTWTQKVPDSDYKNERAKYYIQAYSGAGQPAKVLETASQLMSKDIKANYTPFDALTILSLTAYAVRQLPTATPEQLAIGEKAAQAELEMVPAYFVPANKPAAASEEQWNQAKAKVESDAKLALLYVAMLPGSQAQLKKDYVTAEQEFTKALQKYPDSPQIAYALGSALLPQYKTAPDKFPQGLFEIARAATLDPAKWDAAQTKADADKYLDKAYTQYHGADAEGLAKLKEMAAASPTPPPGFKIKTSSEISAEKEQEFIKTNPQLAFWMGIKRQLADTGGEQYYETSMKDTEIKGPTGKAFKGTLVEAKPACRSKELLVALSDATHPEITLKLETPLTGKPATGKEIQFDGAPSAFTKDPFMLTMATDKTKIDNLTVEACAAAAPARKGPAAKKGTTKKK